MIPDKGVELFLGISENPEFGSLIVCGLGGIFNEVMKNIANHRAPINLIEAKEMIPSLKGYPY